MYARVATFEKRDPSLANELVARVRSSVGIDEVVMSEGGDDAEAARLSIFEGSPDRLDEGTRYAREEIMPQVEQLDGYRGVLSLVDRQAGRTKLITLWESEEAMRASDEPADEFRRRAAEGAASHIVGVERYEVAVAIL